MSTENYLQIYDDNVVKFSIKQGTENDRWPITGDYKIKYSNADDTALKYENNDNLVLKESSTLPGAFTIAELACTRDTNRVFIGNFSSELGGQQQTVGGSLVGNKYLGFIDSKPTLGSDADKNAIPKKLTSSNNTGLLENGSPFRSYNHVISGNTCQPTEDKMWSKQSYYNSKYDAYDGDYMYDIYRNALIIFDHNIKPSTVNSDGSTVNTATKPTENASANNRRITPLIPYSKGDSSVKDFTSDMYGDGYVLLYNVIPDGNTLTFSKKKFAAGSGTNANNPGNYSQNIIKLNSVPIDKITEHLNSDYFTVSNGKITLQNIGSGGGSNTSDVSGILSKYSLKNIYNKTVAANTIIVSDASGFIKNDSGIPITLFDDIETRLDTLENKSFNGDGYATTAEFNQLKTQVEKYHNASGSGETHSTIELIMSTGRASKTLPDMSVWPDFIAGKSGATKPDEYISVEARQYVSTTKSNDIYNYQEEDIYEGDTLKTPGAISTGIIYLKDGAITVKRNGFISLYISNHTGEGQSVPVVVYKTTKGTDPEDDEKVLIENTPVALCRCGDGDGSTNGSAAASCTIPVFAGETYVFKAGKDNDKNLLWDSSHFSYLIHYIF